MCSRFGIGDVELIQLVQDEVAKKALPVCGLNGFMAGSGEKGMLCEKWIFEEKKIITDPITGEKETVYEELEHPKVNYFILFNAAQIEGMPELEKKAPLLRDEQLKLADQFVCSSICPVIENAHETQAYYSPVYDEVHLPERDSFSSSTEFLATAIHEMGHSTGHPSRLNRDQKNIFGSKGYAKEELVAELSSVFVQADLGINIGAKQFSNHAAYLQSWMDALKENPNVLFQASADAAKASDFLLEQYQHSLLMEQKKEKKEETLPGMKDRVDENELKDKISRSSKIIRKDAEVREKGSKSVGWRRFKQREKEIEPEEELEL